LLADDDFGGRINIDWSQAIGKQLIVQVVEEQYEAKDGSKAKRAKLGFAGFWSLDDERVKDVPRDQAAQRHAAGASSAQRNTTSKQNEGTKPPKDDWGDI
jgi:hypothetical protein